MDPARWERLQQTFEAAAPLPSVEWGAAVAALCPDDPALASEVLEMLAEDTLNHPLLDASVDAISASVLALGSSGSIVNQQIGHYRLLRLIGEGGMGVVYLAERTDIGGQVAIKLLRDAWLSPMRRERFAEEQAILAQLNHPAIARIYDADTLPGGPPYFVMEYVDGRPLTTYLREHPGPFQYHLQLFLRMCEAVHYAHGLGIIHRDLKPSNVLVSNQGEVKLLDFGISRRIERSESRRNVTIPELRLMTPEYAAPEQLSGGVIGVFTDIYALGVTLFEILTGQVPERRPGQDQPPRPSAVARAASIHPELRSRDWADLDVLCLCALQNDPARRYASVDAMMQDITAFLEGAPLRARPASWSYIFGKFARRNRTPLLAGTAAVLFVALSILLFTARLTRARNAAGLQAARVRELQQFTESLLDGGDASAGPSLDYTASQIVDLGRRQAEELQNDRLLQADMFTMLGRVYRKLGRLHDAESLIRRGLDQRSQIEGSSSPGVADSLIALGLLQRDEGRLPDAEASLRRALSIERQASPVDIERALWALGTVLNLGGHYQEARSVLEEAVRRSPSPGRSEQAAKDRSALGDTAFYLADFQSAEKHYREAMSISQALYGNRHPSVADELQDLAEIALNQDRYADAEREMRTAVAIDEAWYGPAHPQVATMLCSLARVYTAQKHYEESEALLRRAVSIDERAYGADPPKVALLLNELGVLNFLRNRDSAAEPYFLRALAIWRKAYGDHHQFVGVTYANLASIRLDRHDYPAAEQLLRRALAVYTADQLSGSRNAAIAHVKLGRILLSEKRFAEAQSETQAGYSWFLAHAEPQDSYRSHARKDLLEEKADLARSVSGRTAAHGHLPAAGQNRRFEATPG